MGKGEFHPGQLIRDCMLKVVMFQNSLAIWDNRSTYHAATQDYGGQLRVGDRVVSVVRPALCPAFLV